MMFHSRGKINALPHEVKAALSLIWKKEKKNWLIYVDMERKAVTKAFGHLTHSRYTESAFSF